MVVDVLGDDAGDAVNLARPVAEVLVAVISEAPPLGLVPSHLRVAQDGSGLHTPEVHGPRQAMRDEESSERGHAEVNVVVHLEVKVSLHRRHRRAEPHHRLIAELVVRVRVPQPEKIPVLADLRLEHAVQRRVPGRGLPDHEPKQDPVLRLHGFQRLTRGKPRLPQHVSSPLAGEPGVDPNKRQQALRPPGLTRGRRQRHRVRHVAIRANARVRPPHGELVHGVRRLLTRGAGEDIRLPTLRGPIPARPVAEPLRLVPQLGVRTQLILQLHDEPVLLANLGVLVGQFLGHRQRGGHLLVPVRTPSDFSLELSRAVHDKDANLVRARGERRQRGGESDPRGRVRMRGAYLPHRLIPAADLRVRARHQEPVHEDEDARGALFANLAPPPADDASAHAVHLALELGPDVDIVRAAATHRKRLRSVVLQAREAGEGDGFAEVAARRVGVLEVVDERVAGVGGLDHAGGDVRRAHDGDDHGEAVAGGSRARGATVGRDAHDRGVRVRSRVRVGLAFVRGIGGAGETTDHLALAWGSVLGAATAE